MTTYDDLIAAHGVRVGQVWRHNAIRFASEVEVVYVTPAFAVLHSLEVITPGEFFRAAGIEGVPGRYASPYALPISELKNGLRDGKPRYTFVRESD